MKSASIHISLLALILLFIFSCKNENFDHSIELSEKGDPQGYLDYYSMRRGGKIEPSKIKKAFQDARSFYNKQSARNQKDAGLKSWTWKGPGNIGGRVRALAIRDNGSGIDEIFAGSSGGGMLHSTDAGGTWSFVGDFLPSLIVTCIVIDPTNPDRIYASTGDGFGGSTTAPGAGIMFSVDGGVNWGVLPGTSEWYYINKIAIDPSDPATIYAVRSVEDADLNVLIAGRIERSTTAGLTWEEGWRTNDQAVDVEISNLNPENVLVGTRNGLYRSVIDNGELDFINVPELAGMGRCEVAFAPGAIDFAYALVEANNGDIYRTVTGGESWSLRSSDNNMGPQMWHYNSLFVNPSLSNQIIAGGLDIYRSLDGGISFDTISFWGDFHLGVGAHADNHIFVPSVNYSDDNPVVYVGNDGGVQRIDDIWSGENADWVNLANETFGVTQFYGGDAKKDGSVFIGGTQDNSFCFGSTTANWVQNTTGDGSQAEINYDDESIWYVNLNNNKIRKTIDGGFNWDIIASFETTEFCTKNPGNPCCQVNGPGLDGTPCIDDNDVIRIDDNSPLIGEFIMDPDDPTILYVGATQLWRINDDPGGRSVTLLTNAAGTVTTIAAEDNGQTLWVGYSTPNIQGSFDAGNTWTSFNNLFDLTLAPFTDIAIDPQNSSRLIVSRGGYTQENLFLLEIVNQSPLESIATDISLPFPMQVNTVAFHPTKSNWLYIGTDVGVFASEDNGQNWSITPIFNDIQGEHPNEGPVYSIVEELFWYGDGSVDYPYHLTAVTFGRGMWATSMPVYSHLYVDKNYTGVETGSFSQPFNTLEEANNAAAPGITIVFKSSGIHNEPQTPIILDSRISIQVSSGSVIVQ